jgi:hypothetical protein
MALPYIFSSGTIIASAQVNANFAVCALTDFSNTSNTGSGANVLNVAPTLVVPVLGTPASVTLTNATGLPLTSGVSGILPVLNGGTGTATPNLTQGSGISITGTWPNQTIAATVTAYPGAGIANSTGSAWGTSYSTTGTGTVVALATSASLTTPGIGAGGALFAGSSFTVTLKASASTTGSYNFTLPINAGALSGYVLSTDGAGNTSWVAPATGSGIVVGGSPVTGGTSGYILYNNGGTLGNIQTVPVANGGTGTSTAFTAGSVHFSGAAGVYSQNNAQFFWDNASNRLGIGTTTPSGTIEAQAANATIISTGTAGYGSFYAKGSGTNNSYLFMGNVTNGEQARISAVDTGILQFSNGNTATERMRITGAGFVGVGTTSPGYLFTVNGTSLLNNLLFDGNVHTASNTGAFTIAGGNAYNNGGTIAFYGSAASGVPGGLTFATDSGAGSTERMRITAAGLVCIGTTTTPAGSILSTSGGTIQSNSFGNIGQFEMPNGSASTWYNAGWRNDGSSTYLLVSDVQTTLAAAQTAGFDTLARPFAVNNSTQGVTIGPPRTGVSALTVSGLSAANVNALLVNGQNTGGSETLRIQDTGSSNGVNIAMFGNGSTTPSKYLRVINGLAQWVNDGYASVIWSMDNSGTITQYNDAVFSASYGPSSTLSIGYRGLPINAPGSSYTAVLSDAGKTIAIVSGTTVTIPTNASVAYPTGTTITILNTSGSGNVSISCADTFYLANTSGTTGTRTLAPLGVATAIKYVSNAWVISGNGLT